MSFLHLTAPHPTPSHATGLQANYLKKRHPSQDRESNQAQARPQPSSTATRGVIHVASSRATISIRTGISPIAASIDSEKGSSNRRSQTQLCPPPAEIPVRGLGFHAHGLKTGIVELGWLSIQGVDESVDARVGLRVGLDEARERVELDRWDHEFLSGGQETGVRSRCDGVVSR